MESKIKLMQLIMQLSKGMAIFMPIFAIVGVLLLTGCEKTIKEESQGEYKEEVSWKIAQSWGADLPIFNTPSEYIADQVSRMSGGKFTIEVVHPTNYTARDIFDLVQSGEYQMGHSSSHYWKDRVPNTLYFTTMPFGMTAVEHYAWFHHGGGMELNQEVYEPLGMLSFPGGNTGVQMGGWFNKKINSVKDFDGLKMRIPGLAGEILTELGAEVVNLPAAELFLALEQGHVDALEWVGPSLDFDMGFHQVAKYYYTGWHEPSSELQYMVNLAAYNELSPEYQSMLKTAMRVASYNMYVLSFHQSAKNWDIVLKESGNIGIEVLTFPKPVFQSLRKIRDQLLDQLAANDEQAARIIKSQRDYLKVIRKWTNLSESSYTRSTEN